MAAARLLALGLVGIVLTTLVGCTASADRNTPSSTLTGGVSTPGGATTPILRSCASLVGKPFVAIIGGQLTCSLDAGQPTSAKIAIRKCPSGGPFYVFTAASAADADQSTYVGSYSSPMTQIPSADATATLEQRAACGGANDLSTVSSP